MSKEDSKNELYSIHKFMFPFRFDKIPKDREDGIKDKYKFLKEVSFDDRVRDSLKPKFFKKLEENGWNYQKFKIKSNLDYNRYVYFYDFVRDSIFNENNYDETATSYLFIKDLSSCKDKKYIIKVNKNSYGSEKTYNLEIKEISLKIFDTGIAILTFHLENYKYKESKDILKINDYGRRIYPQFLEEKFDINKTKESFLADFISICNIKDDFIKSDSYIQKNGIYLPKFITEILGENLFTTNKNKTEKLYIQPILDDRMFTLCWYGSENFKDIVIGSNRDSNSSYLNSESWYKFIFVDGNGKSIADADMQRELVKKGTYSRWIDNNTIFGISRYSFIAISDRKWFSLNILLNHMNTIYYDLMIILIAQRASLIRFSDEITAISDIEPDNNLSDKIENLYKNYLRFKNKLYFKEVTAQEQGIELYDQTKGIMRIDEQIDDLSKEINSLNSYAYILEEKEEKEEMNKLTKLGTIFLPPTLVAGFFGMNIFSEGSIDNIAGFFLSFILMFGLTYKIAANHNINIREFFFSPKNKNKEK